MTIDKQNLREKFEKWAEEAGALPWGYLKKQRNASGNYSVQIYTYMWHAWNACHEALLDELEAAEERGEDMEIACELYAESKLQQIKLEAANAAQGEHINQQADRIESLEKKNGELGRALGAAEKRIEELEVRGVSVKFPVPKDLNQGWKIDPQFISKIQDAIGYDEECQCWEGSPSMEMVEAVLIAAAEIKLDERGWSWH